MTFWHTLSSVAASVPGFGPLMVQLQRLGTSTDGRSGTSENEAAGSPLDSVKFSMAIIALSAKLAKSDGAVTFDEVEAFRRIMEVPADEESNVRRLFNLAKQDVAGFEQYAEQVAGLLGGDMALSREVLEGLFVIAAADGVLHEHEDQYLGKVSGVLGMSEASYAHVRSLYFAAPMGPYETLGLDPGASAAAIRARHRELVKEHHPDRLSGLGCSADHIARAQRKLATINAAFDIVARERGL